MSWAHPSGCHGGQFKREELCPLEKLRNKLGQEYDTCMLIIVFSGIYWYYSLCKIHIVPAANDLLLRLTENLPRFFFILETLKQSYLLCIIRCLHVLIGDGFLIRYDRGHSIKAIHDD